MTKICLCVIADDNAVNDGIERMIASVADQIDGLVVIFTGKDATVANRVSRVVYNSGVEHCHYSSNPWNDNFAEQRNVSFKSALRLGFESETDWLFWMDCDDVIGAGTDLRECIRYLVEKRAHAGFMRYDYTVDPETHEALNWHYKERLFRADVSWQWIYPVHENCVGPIATRMVPIPFGYVTHLRGEVAPKRSRNRMIARQWYETSRDTEPIAIYHLANQVYALADEIKVADGADISDPNALVKAKTLGAALRYYRDYVEADPDNHNFVAVANDQMADILKRLGKYDEAIDLYLQGIKLDLRRPRSYVGIAECLLHMEVHEEAISWAELAVQVGKANDPNQLNDISAAVDLLDYQYKPTAIKAHALKALGRYRDAIDAYRHMQSLRDDDFVRGHIKECEDAIDNGLERASDIDRARALRMRHWGDSDHMSIAFYAPGAIEKWDGTTIAGGSGGTESTLYQIARYFRSRGWRVAIFGNPPEDSVDADGIEWYRASLFHPDEPFEVFVSLRDMQIFDAPIRARSKVLWLHDVTIGDQRYGPYGDRVEQIDAIVCPSHQHAKHTQMAYEIGLADAHFRVIPNGIDCKRIADLRTDKRDPKRFVYASSPDRGLDNLLDLWPEIYDAIPGAKLDIFYGWNAIDALIAKGAPSAHLLRAHKMRIEGKITDLRERGYEVNWRGRVDHDTLISAFWQSGLMLYPANFVETFGIVFAQAAACGVITVASEASNVGNVVDSALAVPGPADAETFAPRFVTKVWEAHCATTDSVREWAIKGVQKYDWPNVYDAWDGLVSYLRTSREGAEAA